MISKLLCATDGSKASAKAVEFACEFARQLEVGLTFITVGPLTDEDLASKTGISAVVLSAGDAQQDNDLGLAEAAAKEKGVEADCVAANGHNIAATIIDYAEQNGFGHIIVGSTGKTGISRMMIGSIAQDVVAKAHCPVTVVR